MDLLPSPLVVAAFLILVGVYQFVIHPAYLSPLASVPNAHPLAPFTKLWILWEKYQGRHFETVRSAFQHRGPIVRLSPQELAVNVVDDGLNTVHGGASFAKTEYYSWFENFGELNSFSSLGKDHALRRRRSNHVYAQAYVRASPQVRYIDGLVTGRMLSILSDAASSHGSVDVLSLYFAYSIDTLSAYIFGSSRGTNFLEHEVERQSWLKTYLQSQPAKSMFWLLEMPGLLKRLNAAGLGILPNTYQPARREIGDWALKLVNETEASLHGSSGTQDANSSDYPTVYIQLRTSIAACGASKSKPELFDFESHRHELASVTFSYILYSISTHPATQEALRQELLALNDVSAESLANLPLLHGVIKESLRLRRTKPTPNPRLTPAGRTKIGPYSIPEGVRIDSFSYTLNRNPEVYPQPDRWLPERWIIGKWTNQDAIDQQERWFWTFGKGSRGCLGQHLAMQMMRSILYAIYTRYSTRLVDDSSYLAKDGFVSGQMDAKLLLRIDKL